MYGYVRPFRPELKVREFELYKTTYCGLCHALKENYGFLARFAVSYDMTLLAMALSKGTQTACRHKRCAASPFRKKCVAASSPELDTVAGLTVILAWFKLCDEVADGGFFKALGARVVKLLMRRRYKKAAAAFPEFNALAKRELERLALFEKNAEPSIDAVADCFALITAGFSVCEEDTLRARILKEIFYHVGRAVYILDAADDYPRDVEKNAYNPIHLRFDTDSAELTAEIKERIRETVEQSLASAAAAGELLEQNEFTPIILNILYLGMPSVTNEVLSGTDKKRNGRVI